jgi:hypothetical protein
MKHRSMQQQWHKYMLGKPAPRKLEYVLSETTNRTRTSKVYIIIKHIANPATRMRAGQKDDNFETEGK